MHRRARRRHPQRLGAGGARRGARGRRPCGRARRGAAARARGAVRQDAGGARGRRRRDRGRARDRHGQGGRSRRRRGRHRRPLAAVGGADAAGVPPGGTRAGARRAGGGAGAGDRRRLARGARGRPRAGRRVLARQPEGHHAARPRGCRAAAARAMLTDYHVHLRRDALENTAREAFTAANAERYRTVASERGIEELGVSEHVYRFKQALEVSDHPFWRRHAVDDLDDYCAFVRGETDIRLGIEADFVPGREDRIANLLDGRDWDYVIGSVHLVGGYAVDMEGEWDAWRRGESPERLWTRYFDTVAEAARSGLFDVMAHPDLVKMWGRARPVPDGDPRRWYEPTVEAFLDGGVAVELSTAGLRKPVGGLYPAQPFLELVAEAGLPVALSSDAHSPDELGSGYDEALAALEAAGITRIAVFERRARRLEP